VNSTHQNYQFFTNSSRELPSSFDSVKQTATKILQILSDPKIKSAISEEHHLGASSHQIQAAILEDVENLGFTSEKKGLFAKYKVSGIRPDYFMPLREGGILFEVERGKTLANNMDLLDVWKTHICVEAQHLFLLVPNIRVNSLGAEQKIFQTVCNRIETFFNPDLLPIDVSSVHIFGY